MVARGHDPVSRFFRQPPAAITAAQHLAWRAIRVGRAEWLAGATKCPKYDHFMAMIEKILGVSVAIATVSPWISNK
jgi:hypothetical protein